MWYSARSWLATWPSRWSNTLFSCSAIDSPMVMPPMNCDRAVRGLIDPADREHAEQPRHPDLPGVDVDPRLDELRAERVREWSSSVARRVDLAVDLVAVGSAAAELLAEGAGGLDHDRRAPGVGARRAAGHRGDRVRGVADPHVDVVDLDAQGVGGDLRQDRPEPVPRSAAPISAT